jgi:hypothetical protein
MKMSTQVFDATSPPMYTNPHLTQTLAGPKSMLKVTRLEITGKDLHESTKSMTISN